jgi:drug/metabolite transporter (DMT)-like permease
MSHAQRRRARAGDAAARLPAYRVAGAAVLVVAALLFAPWLAGRLTVWPYAPALAGLVAVPLALYYWFRTVQRTKPRAAASLAAAYGVLAALVLWLLTAI